MRWSRNPWGSAGVSAMVSSLRVELETKALRLGADLFGVADLAPAQGFICRQGGGYLKQSPGAVSIGIRLMDAIVSGLQRHEDPATIYTYRALYNSVNSRLDHIALLLAKRIQEEGFLAFPIPASQTIDPQKLIDRSMPAWLVLDGSARAVS